MRHREAIGTPAEQSPGAQLPAEGRPQRPQDGGAGNGFDWWKAPELLRGRSAAASSARTGAQADAQADVQADVQADARTGADAGAGSGSRPAGRSGTRSGAKSAAKAAGRAAGKSAARAAARARTGAAAVGADAAGTVGAGPQLGAEQLPEHHPAPEARVPEQARGPELEDVVQAAAEADAAFDREQERLRAAHAEVYRHVHDGEEFQLIRRSYRGFVFPACGLFLVWYLGYIVAAVTLPGLMARPVAGPFNVAWLLALLQFVTTFLITWLYARHARDRRDRAALGLRWETQDRLR